MALFGRMDRDLSKQLRCRIAIVLACWIVCAFAVMLIPRRVKKAGQLPRLNDLPAVQLHDTPTGIEFAIPSATLDDVKYELRKGEIAIFIRGHERVYSIGAKLDTSLTNVQSTPQSVLIRIPNAKPESDMNPNSKNQQQKEN